MPGCELLSGCIFFNLFPNQIEKAREILGKR
jgi:hypothetical protein